MLRRAMRWLPPIAVPAVLLFAFGCSQDAGEVCQVNRDCAGGLVCSRGQGASRGTCITPGSEDAGPGGAGGTGGLFGTGGTAPSDEDAGGAPTNDAGASDADGG